MAPVYNDEKMDSLFSTRDPVYHKALKVPVAQLFSMTNMKNFEPVSSHKRRTGTTGVLQSHDDAQSLTGFN